MVFCWGLLLAAPSAWKEGPLSSAATPTVTSARAWLEALGPSIPYTLLRSSGQGVVGLSLHLERLQHAARFYGFDVDEDEVRRALREAIDGVSGVSSGASSGASSGVSSVVAVVAAPRAGDVRVLSRSSPVPPMAPKRVATARGRRRDPSVKTTTWCFDRKPLEVGGDLDEVLLVDDDDDDRRLLEGLVHNVAVVKEGGHIFTAEDDVVLPGIAMRHALDAAERRGFNVHRTAPSLEDAASWTEVFITNANALCQPVSEIVHAGDTVFSPPKHEAQDSVVARIRDLVLDDIVRQSPPWWEPI